MTEGKSCSAMSATGCSKPMSRRCCAIPPTTRPAGADAPAALTYLLFRSAGIWVKSGPKDVTPHSPHTARGIMANSVSLEEVERRIQIVEDTLRELVEQAAAYSGAADEERNAQRIADQQAKLDALLKEREALMAKS